MHSDAAAVNFQLNSHLSTLANIHKIYHTFNKLNLTEDDDQDDHQTGSLRSCSSSDCFNKVMPPRKKGRPASGDDLSVKKSRHDSMYRKYDSTRIKTEEETFSNKRFYEYAGTDDVVGPEGMEKFCEDIGVEPENVAYQCRMMRLRASEEGQQQGPSSALDVQASVLHRATLPFPPQSSPPPVESHKRKTVG
uniref:Uncharacterized protein n=1 Tax=Callithrix jacchus TaxID=9483 RepID=A0A2R8MVN8_CALJA